MMDLLNRITGKKTFTGVPFRRIFLGVLIAAGAASYANTFQAEFTFDGRRGIAENRGIRNLWNVSEYCAGPKLSRCLTYFSFALNYQVHGYHVQGYHALNLALHIGNAWLVFLLLLVFFKTPALSFFDRAAPPLIAAFAALLFLVHPVQTQAVTYVWQRGTLLGTLFYLLSVYFYVSGRIRSSLPRLLGAFFCIIAGTLSKEIIFTVPLTLLVLETGFFNTKDKPSRRLVWLWVLFLATLLIIPLKLAANFEMKFYMAPHFYNGRISAVGWDYLLTQINVVRTYFRILFVPFPLNLDYHYPITTSFFEWKTVLSFLLEASVFAAGFVLFLKKGLKKLAGFGILWFFITLSVESSLIPLRDVIFEHRLYLPSVGFAAALSCAVWTFSKKFKWAAALSIVVLCIFSVMTFQRNFVWMNDFTLWSDVARKTPENPRPHQLIGAAYVRKAETLRRLGRPNEAVHSYEAALDSYEKALSLGADKSEIYSNSGALHEKLGRLDAAEELLTKAVEENPESSAALYNFGVLLLRKGNYDEALSYFERVVSMNPRHADAFNNAGSISDMKGQREKALRYLNRAVELAPEHYHAYQNLGYHFAEQGKWDEAIKNFKMSIRHNPRHLSSYTELAKIYLKQNRMKEFTQLLQDLFTMGESELASQLEQIRMLSFMSVSTGQSARKDEPAAANRERD